MARIVMKFGGTSVADLDRIRTAAERVKREADAGHEIAVIVSATFKLFRVKICCFLSARKSSKPCVLSQTLRISAAHHWD